MIQSSFKKTSCLLFIGPDGVDKDALIFGQISKWKEANPKGDVYIYSNKSVEFKEPADEIFSSLSVEGETLLKVKKSLILFYDIDDSLHEIDNHRILSRLLMYRRMNNVEVMFSINSFNQLLVSHEVVTSETDIKIPLTNILQFITHSIILSNYRGHQYNFEIVANKLLHIQDHCAASAAIELCDSPERKIKYVIIDWLTAQVRPCNVDGMEFSEAFYLYSGKRIPKYNLSEN